MECCTESSNLPPAQDPSGARSEPETTHTGVARLGFYRPSSAPGTAPAAARSAPIPVGVAPPLTFSFPSPNVWSSSAPEAAARAACAAWDDQLGWFSTGGCATQPNPLPRTVSADWADDLALQSQADIARAWVLRDAPNATAAAEDSLLSGCSETVLRCGDPADAARVVWLDPTDPLRSGAVGCAAGAQANGTAAVLRVFHGARCRLWRADNSEGCFWCAGAHRAFGRSLAILSVASSDSAEP